MISIKPRILVLLLSDMLNSSDITRQIKNTVYYKYTIIMNEFST